MGREGGVYHNPPPPSSPAWVEMPAQKHDGQRRLENGCVTGRSGAGGENLGQKQKVKNERNPDV